MTNDLARRDFLKASVAFAGAAAANAFSCVEIASAAPIAVPTRGQALDQGAGR